MNRVSSTALFVVMAMVMFAGCADDGAGSYGYYGGGAGTFDAGNPFDALGFDDVRAPEPQFGKITVSYLSQSDPTWSVVRDGVRDSAYLDELANRFTNAFELPTDLKVKVGLCGTANAFYIPNEREILMCLELVVAMYVAFESTGQWDVEASEQRAHLGYLWVYVHELGHALWDMFEIASLGSEEDAVDDFATILLIEAGLGWSVLAGADYFALVENGTVTRPALADEHGLGIERLYNAACLLYGSDPATYGAVLESLPDLIPRSPRCPAEFIEKRDDLDRLLEPYLRQD